MNIGVLNNIVEKLILPKSPWIKDYIWSTHHTGGERYYTLELTVDEDFFMQRTDTTELHRKLYMELKMLFKMVGPLPNEYFDDVEIKPED